MALETYSFQLNGVPLLTVSDGTPTAAALRGTVLLLHGQGVAKEVNRGELERFAAEGFLAIGLDAVGHGERRFKDFDERFAPGANRYAALIEIVVATVHEIPALISALKQAGLAHDGGVGLCGISMGGFITYGAIPSKVIDAAVAIIASPVWKVDVPEHPVRHSKAFFPTAVLSQVAGKDELVDAGLVKSFHDRLAREYQGAPGKQAYVVYPESGHTLRPQDWEALMERTVQWFRQFLKPTE